MALDHTSYHLAARNLARSLVVASTGLTTLSATATGYARTAGSFYDEGFWRGMELVPSGFSSATPRVITDVTPLTITVNTTSGAVPVQAAAPGRSLTVGLPSTRLWEDEPLTNPTTGAAISPAPGAPYIEEQYIDGPSKQVTMGHNGEIEGLPMYVLLMNLPTANGLALGRYTDALLRQFAPRTAMALANGDVLRVRSDVAPFAGQLQAGQPGFAVKAFKVPLRIRTQNSI
jgi:hypothetical protein